MRKGPAWPLSFASVAVESGTAAARFVRLRQGALNL
ncbi:hypothetical protein SMJ63A_20308 [Stenotrophomonas geniculata]